MKKLAFLTTLVCISVLLFAQTPRELDSVKQVIDTTKDEKAKVLALCRLSYWENDDPVRRLTLVTEALKLARAIKYEKGEAQCYHQLGNHFIRIADYSKSMEYYLKALKIRETLNDQEGFSTTKSVIGLVYANQGNFRKALDCFFEGEKALKQVASPEISRWPQLYDKIGSAYQQLGLTDSALIYYNRAYEYAVATNGKYYLSYPLTGLARVNTTMGNTELALSYFNKSITNSLETNNQQNLWYAYFYLSKLYTQIGKRDSAIFYAKKVMDRSQEKQFPQLYADAAKQLALLYENIDDKESLRYYKLATEIKDSILNSTTTAQIQSMTFNEQERQRDINANKIKDAEIRNHNLQYAAIAIGLIAFIILFFALSRSVIVKTGFISFFAILGLLAVFEFINLLIHPYLSQVTHDSPVLMLLVLIAIGALLIPLHHKLEKWITNVMTEKNRKIRLASAKKTIATLESK